MGENINYRSVGFDDLVFGPTWYADSSDVVAVVVVQDKHISVAAGGCG